MNTFRCIIVLLFVLVSGCSDKTGILEAKLRGANQRIEELEEELEKQKSMPSGDLKELKELRAQREDFEFEQDRAAVLSRTVQELHRQVAELRERNRSGSRRLKQISARRSTRSGRSTGGTVSGRSTGSTPSGSFPNVSVFNIIGTKTVTRTWKETVERKRHIMPGPNKCKFCGKHVKGNPYVTKTMKDYAHVVNFGINNMTGSGKQVSVSAGMGSKSISVPTNRTVQDKVSAKSGQKQVVVSVDGSQKRFNIKWR